MEKYSPPEVETDDPDGMLPYDKVTGWLEGSIDDSPLDPELHNREEMSSDDPTENDSNEEEEVEGPGMTELPPYRDFIVGTPAYEWLLARLRRELFLTPSEPNTMGDIADAIRQEVFSLPSFRNLSRNKSPQVCKMIFEIEWDPLAFVKEQEYQEQPDEAVERAITLTGAAKDAQALTCAQYLHQTWPLAGEHTIQLVKDVVRHDPGSRHTRKSSDLQCI